MDKSHISPGRGPARYDIPVNDEGGLRAPPELTGWRKAWWWFDFIILVKLARLRFVAVLVVIGAVITQWDRLSAYYDKWTRPAGTVESVASDVEWFCPMHPAVIRDSPRDKCPICFMPLSKRKKGDGHEDALPAGVVNRVQLSPYRIVLAGVQTWPVSYQPLTKGISAVGFVEFNERGQKNVSARMAGRIEKLLVNETGQMVEADDALATIYSPDLQVTVRNMLDAEKAGNQPNYQSARRKLQLLGIAADELDELVKSQKSSTTLTIRSPIAGHVIKKYVREGQYVEEGGPLYDVADLSTVWIQAQVYEDDIEFLPFEQAHKGSVDADDGLAVVATTRSFPNEPFHGKLTFVYPHVDQDTRTVTVRCELKNPGHKLRPGTTATVVLNIPPGKMPVLTQLARDNPAQREHLDRGEVLAVPETSVIDTGSQTIVYRQASPGVFEGVLVKLGPRMAGPEGVMFYPVLSGIEEQDAIITSGSFLVDAETRLNPAAGSIYFGGSGGSKNAPSVTAVKPSTPEDESAKIAAALAKLPAADRKLATAQQYCPVLTGNLLGSMGPPVKVVIEGQSVFLCCSGCKKQALAKPAETLARAKKSGAAGNADEGNASKSPLPVNDRVDKKIAAALAKLSAADRKLAEAQKFCAVLDESRLGSMGTPIKVMVDGQAVFVCCAGCTDEALADPPATLAKVKELISQKTPSPK